MAAALRGLLRDNVELSVLARALANLPVRLFMKLLLQCPSKDVVDWTVMNMEQIAKN